MRSFKIDFVIVQFELSDLRLMIEIVYCVERIGILLVTAYANVLIFFHVCLLQTGGPDWEVELGRLDILTSSQEDSDNIMPSATSNATTLIDLFQRFNLTVKDLVALSGSHFIGKARCFLIMTRLYNQSCSGKPDPTIDPGFKAKLDKQCPLDVDQNKTLNLDSTPVVFDNQYFKDLVAGKGFLNSDHRLFTFPQTKGIVRSFSIKKKNEFFKAFVEGMLKMSDLQSGRPGEVRKNCRVVNARPVHVLFEDKMKNSEQSI